MGHGMRYLSDETMDKRVGSKPPLSNMFLTGCHEYPTGELMGHGTYWLSDETESEQTGNKLPLSSMLQVGRCV